MVQNLKDLMAKFSKDGMANRYALFAVVINITRLRTVSVSSVVIVMLQKV